MNIVRWNPLREFDDLFTRATHLPHSLRRELQADRWVPRADVTETDAGYCIELELPAVPAADVDVSVTEGVLSVTGERKASFAASEANGGRVHRLERLQGKFERSFKLPEDADADNVSASFKDGVLALSIARRPEVQRKAIEITTD